MKQFVRGVLLGVPLAALLAGPVRAAVLWDGDASKGTGVFGNLQPINGTIAVVDDPTYGKVFKIVCDDNGNTKARSEVSRMQGITLSNSGDYYIGWRSKWGPLPTQAGKWQVLSQIHLSGPGSIGGPVPFGLSVPGDGQMHFNAQDPDGRSTSLWDHSLPLDSWHKYVMHMQMGETLATGVCELWFDGVKQTLTNGQQSIPCAMSHANSGSYWKWGVYRSGHGGPIGQSVHYLQRPMLGTTYADVADRNETGASDGGADRGGGAPDGGNGDTGGSSGSGRAEGGAGGSGEAGSGGTGGMGSGGAGGDSGGGADASGTGDSSVTPGSDTTNGRGQPPEAGGCACRAAATSGAPSLAGLFPLVLAAAALLRRRRSRRW